MPQHKVSYGVVFGAFFNVDHVSEEKRERAQTQKSVNKNNIRINVSSNSRISLTVSLSVSHFGLNELTNRSFWVTIEQKRSEDEMEHKLWFYSRGIKSQNRR